MRSFRAPGGGGDGEHNRSGYPNTYPFQPKHNIRVLCTRCSSFDESSLQIQRYVRFVQLKRRTQLREPIRPKEPQRCRGELTEIVRTRSRILPLLVRTEHVVERVVVGLADGIVSRQCSILKVRTDVSRCTPRRRGQSGVLVVRSGFVSYQRHSLVQSERGDARNLPRTSFASRSQTPETARNCSSH